MRSLLDEVVDSRALSEAWGVVQINDAADGIIAPGIARFADVAQEKLAEIRTAVLGGIYRPAPLAEVEIVDPDRGKRELHIPAVRDRVLERSIVSVLSPIIDPMLSPWSFAYRPGLGTTDALRALVTARESGATCCLRTDVKACFDRIGHDVALGALARWIDDQPLLDLVGQLLRRPVGRSRAEPTGVGIPQGSPLSPLIANVVLDQFDMRLYRRGFAAIRYADDVTIPTTTRTEAEEALVIVTDALKALELEPNPEKTEVMAFAEGFAFLGEDVNSKYPPPEVLERRSEPDRKVLYVGRDGAAVRVSKGQMLVMDDDQELLRVPTSHVGAICLMGNVGLSAGARQFALANNVEVSFLSRRGQFQGWLQSANGPGFGLRRSQIRSTDNDEFTTRMASHFVAGKIANLRALLLRYGNRDDADNVVETAHDLQRFFDSARVATSVPEVRGIEGAASAAYFRVFGQLLPEPFTFELRSRQPPKDPVNACLSFGYMTVLSSVVGAVASTGLDPSAGFLHDEAGPRPSLALDLLEEFRPLIVDTAVLNVFRRRILTGQHFRTEEPGAGIRLTDQGRRKFLAALEDRTLEQFAHVPSGKRVSYRRAMFLQARLIANAIRSGIPDYEATSWR